MTKGKIAGGAALAALLLLAPARAEDAPGALIKPGAIVKDPGDYQGRFVHVKAEVDHVFNAGMFTLDEDAAFAGPDLLVLVPHARDTFVSEGEVVVVGGVVRSYAEADFEKDFDFFERGKLIDTATKVEWKTRPVIIASSVQSSDKNTLRWQASPDAPPTGVGPGGTVTASQLVKTPGRYYGHTVQVMGKVEDALSRTMFTLDEDALLHGPELLVLYPRGLEVASDQEVIVTGEVRRFVEHDLDRDFEFFDEGKLLNVKTKVDWKDRPVLVARQVRLNTAGR